MKIFRIRQQAGRVQIPTGMKDKSPDSAGWESEDIETFTHKMNLPDGTIIWGDPSESKDSDNYFKNRRPLWGIQKPGQDSLQTSWIGAPPKEWDPIKAQRLPNPKVFRTIVWNDVS